MGADSCGYVHIHRYMCILRSEANVPCLPQSLSTLFGGTGSLTENLELGWARLTGLHGPGSSCLLFPQGGRSKFRFWCTTGNFLIAIFPGPWFTVTKQNWDFPLAPSDHSLVLLTFPSPLWIFSTGDRLGIASPQAVSFPYLAWNCVLWAPFSGREPYITHLLGCSLHLQGWLTPVHLASQGCHAAIIQGPCSARPSSTAAVLRHVRLP